MGDRKCSHLLIDRTTVSIHKGAIYIIRDNPEWIEGADVSRCQYAAPVLMRTDIPINSWDIEWKPRGEGTMFDDIEPFATLADLIGVSVASLV